MLWTTETRKSKVPQGLLAFAGLYEIIEWCRETGLNCPHVDFQSTALPTELSRREDMSTKAWPSWQAFFVFFLILLRFCTLAQGRKGRKSFSHSSFWGKSLLYVPLHIHFIYQFGQHVAAGIFQVHAFAQK